MSSVFVSVIIPTYKDWPRLKLCLDALSNQTYPHDQFEVIVVNNDPEEACPFELPAENMKIITEAKPGSYAARNAGIKIARGEILGFTDSDCIPDEEWIQVGVNMLLDNNNQKTIVCGFIDLFFKRPDRQSLAECYEKHFAFPHQQTDKTVLNAMVTANVFILSQTFQLLGYFDDRMLSGGDGEFGQRAVKSGYTILFGRNAIIKHPARHSVFELTNKRRRVFGGKVYKSVYAGKSLKKALFNELKKSFWAYTKNIYLIIAHKKKTPFKDGIKCIIMIVLIMLSILHESFVILISNKAKRR